MKCKINRLMLLATILTAVFLASCATQSAPGGHDAPGFFKGLLACCFSSAISASRR